MTTQPGTGPRDVAAEVRGAARREARRWAGAGPIVIATAIVVVFMTAFIILDYTFDQDPHRVIKVGLGLLALGLVMSRPHAGLLLLPVVTPFLTWVPPLPVPGLNALNVLLFGVFSSFAVAQVLAHRPLMRLGAVGPAILMLLGLAALSIVRGAAAPTGYGYNAANAFTQLVRSSSTFATYFIVLAMSRDAKDRRRITWAVLVGLGLEAFMTMRLGRNGSGSRATGSIGQANELGAYLALFSVVAAAIAVGARGWFGRLVAFGIFLLGGYGIMLSLSRGSMLAIVAGLGIVLWRLSRWALVLMVVALASAPLWVPDYVVERVNSSRVEDQDENGALDPASEARIMTWRATIEVITHHPIDGVGFTGLQFVLPDVGAAMGLTDIKDSAHNTYLRMLSELGAFGLFLFVFVLWKVWRVSERAAKAARSRFDRAIAVGTGGAVVTMLVSCAFGDRFWSPVVVSSLWVMAAVTEDSLRHPAPEGAS